ncbi:glycoside hydrolase family 2 TIM barrel-domain containing protein [Flammeovirgaceae bacterium SG7u.111]|nr:glycoside hydrolase family 2 TIM barrel-domain containing protein [Flammeovirgaceae bacterium SG7u.132]WPO33662.1 glycoside hydrolase family 2 TIM barrel-domain containing protein [Flammeovirgaceae bacterium SG7u.111]
MKKYYYSFTFFFFIVIGAYFVFPAGKDNLHNREIDFNSNWKFSLVDKDEFQAPQINAINWKNVQLPHDWSVEASFDSINGEGATGYLPGGYGLYQKEFKLDPEPGHTFYIYFDGVYNNSEVWLNGKKLGEHPYGYSPFYFDITDQLQTDGNNLLVKVDHSRYADSRWYSGSGIYRNVKLITTADLHIPVWGTFITTPEITKSSATVSLKVTVKNKKGLDEKFDLHTQVFDPSGALVAEVTEKFEVGKNSQSTFSQKLNVSNPLLWDIQFPNIYKAVTSVVQGGEVIDVYETPFGIRTIHFDKDKGFFLNGKNMKIKGVCLHHDGGLVGAAVPKAVWRRRLETLKEGGCNAIRVSHNPASDEFLQLCDEMGFLVQEEFFDEWDNPKDKRLNQNEQSVDYITRGYAEHFQEWAERDLKSTMLRSRNHPSIFQWSIGNEIEWTYPSNAHATGFFNMSWNGNYFWSLPPISPEEIKKRYEENPKGKYAIEKTAQKLAKWTRELDTTRYIIANCILPSASHISGYADALDIVGYSYRRVLYDYGHENYPDKIIMGTENLGQWHEWKSIEERPHISGTFLWTGIDYMGESNKQWPRKATPSGLLDLAGFEKPSYHMMKTLWTEEPHIYISSQTESKSIFKVDEATGEPVERKPNGWEHALWFWHDVNEHWNYEANEVTIVEVLSNCEEVELFLNGKSLGTKKLESFPDRIYKWAVPFEAGKLEAKGKKAGTEIAATIQTAGKPSSIELSVEEDANSLDANDVVHVIAQVLDENGNPVKNEEVEIEFATEGAVKILGVDNGAADNVQKFQSNKIVTSKGRTLMLLQLQGAKSNIVVSAKSGKLAAASLKL